GWGSTQVTTSASPTWRRSCALSRAFWRCRSDTPWCRKRCTTDWHRRCSRTWRSSGPPSHPVRSHVQPKKTPPGGGVSNTTVSVFVVVQPSVLDEADLLHVGGLRVCQNLGED